MKLLLHERAAAALDGLGQTRLGSYLFYGPAHVGKATAAAELARRLACPDRHAEPDSACPTCRQFMAGAYPDFHYAAPTDKPSLTIEQIRRLTTALATRAYQPSAIRTAIIDDAHSLTIDAQNALLKLIEEPPPATLIVLVTDRPEELLPTVQSRLAHVYFPLPQTDQVITLLTTRFPEFSAESAAELVSAAAGAPGTALTLAAAPDTAASERELMAAARTTPDLSRFDRLLLAAKLSDTKADLTRFQALLQAEFTAALRTGRLEAAAVAPNLAALEKFRRQLAAGVGRRLALECLMLELTP